MPEKKGGIVHKKAKYVQNKNFFNSIVTGYNKETQALYFFLKKDHTTEHLLKLKSICTLLFTNIYQNIL